MTDPHDAAERYRRGFVLILTFVVCLGFAALVRNFLVAVLMAAVFSALLHPLYGRVQRRLRTGPAVTSGIVILALAIAVGIPVFAFAGLAAAEALAVSKAVGPWLSERIGAGGALAFELPGWLPFREELEPYKTQIFEKAGQAAGTAGQFLFNSLTQATRGTFGVLLNLFIFAYAMFFFLKRGPELVDTALRYLPLGNEDRERLIERGLTVTRATLRSILIIGVLQGVLVGLAFWLLGIGGPVFWGTVVLVLSAIPALGAAIVWIPAAIYLLTIGDVWSAVGLTLWGALIVSLVDNVLRPRLVGEEANIPDLLILLAILGGIGAFGATGILVGPILVAVFLTVIEIYRTVFRDSLPSESGPGE